MRVLTLALIWCAACASMPSETNRMKPDHAPTPYSAEEIRAGCAAGRVSVYLIEAPMEDPVFQTFRFNGGGATHATFTVAMKGATGKAGPARAAKIQWTGLQSHASFPAANTVITEESVRTPAGTFDCWLYTVTGGKDRPNSVKRLYFAKDMPGPPVRMTDESDGKLTTTMTLVEHTVGG